MFIADDRITRGGEGAPIQGRRRDLCLVQYARRARAVPYRRLISQSRSWRYTIETITRRLTRDLQWITALELGQAVRLVLEVVGWDTWGIRILWFIPQRQPVRRAVRMPRLRLVVSPL